MNGFSYDINAKTIIIQNGTEIIPDEYFINNEIVEEIIIPSSVSYIGKASFKGCKSLKKITLPNSLKVLDDFAFSDCISLKEITIPSSLHYFSSGLFSNCYNLNKVNTHDEIDYINDFAFYNCKSLKDFNIPLNTTSIGKMAFMGCEKIRKIKIPKKTEVIEIGAFSLINSLEKITVDKDNENYFTINDNTVLLNKDGVIIQYAINSNNEEFTVDYCTNKTKINLQIYNISDYAFAGCKKLKKIYLNSQIESIGGNTFLECNNLKELEILHSNYSDSFLLNIFNSPNQEIHIPFENIIINEGIKTLCDHLSELFKNITNIILPQSLEYIGKDVFTKSKNLKQLNLPNNIKTIKPNTFYKEIIIKFPNSKFIKAKDFDYFETKTSTEHYIKTKTKENIKIFSLTDGTYYIKIDDYDIIKLNKDEILKLSNTYHTIIYNPDKLIFYLIDLISINEDYHDILTNIWKNPKMKEIFNKLINYPEYKNQLSSKKIEKIIKEIINNNDNYDELLFREIIMKCLTKEDIIKIIVNYNFYIDRFFKLSNKNQNKMINVDKLIKYCSILEKYQQYDKLLYNPIFFEKLNLENQELIIKYFNKNIKHLLNNSEILNDNYGENLNDLIKMCKALGIFGENKKLSQQMTMFINENIFTGENKIIGIGYLIHNIFGDIKPREEIDYEFITFFKENYNELIELEKSKSGTISRMYNSFREISKSSTSQKGEQRHLKVTIQRCLDYFINKFFENVTEENKKLAYLLHEYYSGVDIDILKLAETIIKESYNAPRNIFSKINYDEFGNKIYSYNEEEDLIDDKKDDFYYHWLPKQDYDNLILGKYCNCCAHIISTGAGIMRASMILDNCQNLVIRNNQDEIIAKMTIYVNREKGYAVFNTAEINLNYRPFLEEISNAFIKGANAFVDRYNKNNTIPIKTVSIGEYRNFIKDYLGNIETTLYETPNYSDYGYYVNDKKMGTYDGDSKNKQILVLKK